jgi:hypothetical protein
VKSLSDAATANRNPAEKSILAKDGTEAQPETIRPHTCDGIREIDSEQLRAAHRKNPARKATDHPGNQTRALQNSQSGISTPASGSAGSNYSRKRRAQSRPSPICVSSAALPSRLGLSASRGEFRRLTDPSLEQSQNAGLELPKVAPKGTRAMSLRSQDGQEPATS